ncbi:MAG TPA: single-stranded DNA-binding protein [Micromonosporaceae bacterium]
MNDTHVTVVGNLVTQPELRRLEGNGTTVVHFRVGSTARRYDKDSGGWIDGNSLFVNVSCWRGLADNVSRSLFKGDPVMVTGRLYGREYQAEDGSRRVSYELEATAIGHNLARGTSTFRRIRPAPATEATEEAGPANEVPTHRTGEAADAPDTAHETEEDYRTDRLLEPAGLVAD